MINCAFNFCMTNIFGCFLCEIYPHGEFLAFDRSVKTPLFSVCIYVLLSWELGENPTQLTKIMSHLVIVFIAQQSNSDSILPPESSVSSSAVEDSTWCWSFRTHIFSEMVSWEWLRRASGVETPFLDVPINWGSRIHWLHLCRRLRLL